MRTSFKKFFDAFERLNSGKKTATVQQLALVYRLRLLLEKRYGLVV